MSLLLDTHVLLWWMLDAPELADEHKTTITESPAVYVSAATMWEIAIKRGRGRLDLIDEIGAGQSLERDALIDELPISWRHALMAGTLPSHHNDPFDRVLVAQAKCEGLTLVTRDKRIQDYDVPLLVV